MESATDNVTETGRWTQKEDTVKWYAETPGRRSRQMGGDLLLLAWVVLWVLVGRGVFGVVRLLAAPAEPLQDAGSTWSGRIGDVAASAVEIPLVGNRLEAPLLGAAGAGDRLVTAGERLDEGVTSLAWLLSVAVAGLPILLVGGLYLVLRFRSVRRMTALARSRAVAGDRELLALRALVNQSPRRLAEVGPDAAAGWREGDPEVVAALASLELRRAGLLPAPRPA